MKPSQLMGYFSLDVTWPFSLTPTPLEALTESNFAF